MESREQASRVAFRACHSAFEEIRLLGPHADETQRDFALDFELTARRALDPAEFRLFRRYFLDGARASECERHFGISRAQLLTAIAAMQARVGRVAREMRPHPLFPTDRYFSGRQG